MGNRLESHTMSAMEQEATDRQGDHARARKATLAARKRVRDHIAALRLAEEMEYLAFDWPGVMRRVGQDRLNAFNGD